MTWFGGWFDGWFGGWLGPVGGPPAPTYDAQPKNVRLVRDEIYLVEIGEPVVRVANTDIVVMILDVTHG